MLEKIQNNQKIGKQSRGKKSFKKITQKSIRFLKIMRERLKKNKRISPHEFQIKRTEKMRAEKN